MVRWSMYWSVGITSGVSCMGYSERLTVMLGDLKWDHLAMRKNQVPAQDALTCPPD